MHFSLQQHTKQCPPSLRALLSTVPMSSRTVRYPHIDCKTYSDRRFNHHHPHTLVLECKSSGWHARMHHSHTHTDTTYARPAPRDDETLKHFLLFLHITHFSTYPHTHTHIHIYLHLCVCVPCPYILIFAFQHTANSEPICRWSIILEKLFKLMKRWWKRTYLEGVV